MARARFSAPVIAAAALLTLGGCWSYAPPGSYEYTRGYVDGCGSGYNDAGWDIYMDRYRKDSDYATQPDYKRGWDEAHDKCYNDEITHPHMSRGGSEHI